MKSGEMLRVKGFARTQIVEDGKIVGDSGWQRNTVVNLGFQDYIVGSIGAVAGSKQVSYMAIGTGTAPGVADTSLAGETGVRVTTSNSAVSSKTLQCTAQFAGSDMGSTCTIQNVALANTSSGGTILSGTTYATSQWALRLWRRVMVTLLKVSVKFGGHLIRETIPSQALNKIREGVETIRRTLRIGVEDIVRAIWRHIELGRNDLTNIINGYCNKIANQNVNATLIGRVELLVTAIKKLVKVGENLIRETIPSQAKKFLEGVETGWQALLVGVEGTVRTV